MSTNRAGAAAAELVEDGFVVGLGTGQAANEFLHALALRQANGLRFRGVPTSQATADLARELGIPLTNLEEVDTLDIAVDGADEIDPNLNLVKGWGGALVRERIVAASARRFIVVASKRKEVNRLGERGRLPVEVIPFGLTFVQRKLKKMGHDPEIRMFNSVPYRTDNGNPILDCAIQPTSEPESLALEIRAIPGVLDTGFFLRMTERAYIQDGDTVKVRFP